MGGLIFLFYISKRNEIFHVKKRQGKGRGRGGKDSALRNARWADTLGRWVFVVDVTAGELLNPSRVISLWEIKERTLRVTVFNSHKHALES